MDNISLINAPLDQELVILAFEGGESFTYKLNRIGLYPGDMVRIIRKAPLKGPLLLESEGREIALGRGVAARVMVGVSK